MAKTASGLVAYCKAQLWLPYWMGTFGQIATAALYKSNKARLPAYYTATDFPSQYGKRVHDCVGLIKGYRWSATPTSTPVYNASQDVPVSGLYNQCSKRGPISTMPKVPGTCVFMPSHVGVYIGDGYVIEARGHAYGVVKTKLSGRGWVNWGQPSWLTYDTVADGASTSMVEKKGMDVSYANGKIDWSKVSSSNIKFAIIRVGCGDYQRNGTMTEDSQFRNNVKGAKANGIHIGYYWFCYAKTAAEAKKEADFCCDLIEKYGEKPTFPVCFDYEYDSEKKAPPTDGIVAIAKAWLSRVRERGYYVANYTNQDYLNRGFRKLTSDYDTWLAEWNNNANPSMECGIWQYRSTGTVNGISGNVDLDWSYKDYPTIIKKASESGSSSSTDTTPTTPTKTEETCMVEYKVLKKGDSNSTVRSWQFLLNGWAEKTGKNYSCGTADGKFGPKTETATKNFQKAYGLSQTGEVNKAEWEVMMS